MIQVTEKAAGEIKRLKSKEPDSDRIHLRVQVVGGGCSGMSYKLGFDKEAPKATDKVFEMDGFNILVDSKSLLFLQGMTLDFTDGLSGTGFVFNNPNAKGTCGCGSSFKV